MESTFDDAVVAAARDGDPDARARLAADCLPLVYSVVGRAMRGHADVDDVVQETMVRALGKLAGLRDVSSFRSWLIAIAMNQLRTHYAARDTKSTPLAHATEPADPVDFADLTILRLQLSGERREVVEASRWLDDSERDVLSLWWLEAAGTLSRAELADSLGMSPQHAAVRVQRVKNQLETARTVVRALSADPPCAELASVTAAWDGSATPLWRKRVSRHVRDCPVCHGGTRTLVPVEGLLAGIGLVVPLYAGTALWHTIREAAVQVPASNAASVLAYSGAAVAVAAVATLVFVWPPSAPPDDRGGAAPSSTGTPHAGRPAPLRSTAHDTAPTTAPPTTTSAPPSRSPAPSPRPSRTSPPPAPPQDRVLDRVNALRAHHGCTDLLPDARLAGVARRHVEDMRTRGYVGHTDSSGRGTGDRVLAAGYAWSAVGETLAHGPRDPQAAVEQWMRETGRDSGFLNCAYRHVGVGVVDSPSGPYWAQVLGTPR